MAERSASHDRAVDRATFGWGVVVPIWLATPVAAAFAWRGLDDDARRIAAIAVGLVVGGAAMLLALPPDADQGCQFGAIPRTGTWIPPVLIGAVLGGGVAASSLAAANRVADGHTPTGIVIGVGTQAAAMALALLLTIGLFMGPVCERPPI